MARSAALTVDEYLAELSEDRRRVVSDVRDVIVRHLPQGFVETMNWGMISYELPLSRAIGDVIAAVPADAFIAQYERARAR